MNIFTTFLFAYFIIKSLILLLELCIYRKEIKALFLLSKNIKKSLYKKGEHNSHYLIYDKYEITFYDIKPDKIFIKILSKKEQYITIENLKKTSFIGFLLKIKFEKLEKKIIKIISEYKNTKSNNSTIIGHYSVNN